MTREHLRLPVTISRGAILFLLMAILAPTVPATSQESPAQALGKTRNMAEMQHEIVMLLIQKKEYEKALGEAAKIFDMKWPIDQEPLLLKELLFISDKLLQEKQAPLAVRLLDSNSKVFRTNASQVSILKEKGYLYKSLNEADKALECFRQAQLLEKKAPG
jgi:tetratricopeptide (TPR) repeat protein